MYNSKLIALHGANIQQFNSNDVTKIVNVYIVYDLDNRSKNPPRKFISKNCLFGSTDTVIDNNSEKYMYSSYIIAFDWLIMF